MAKHFQIFGDLFNGFVKKVNGVGPDSSGNVEIDSGGVKKVNGVGPDESGNVDAKVSDTELILGSSTASSNKRFKITVDDTGTISATEVTA